MIRTVSLETAKLLKENGFRQDSYHFYYPILEHEVRMVKEPYERAVSFPTGKTLRWELAMGYEEDYCGNDVDKIAAPTTDEFLEELPAGTSIRKQFSLGFEVWNPYIKSGRLFINESLPEALAQCWIYLKKEGFLDKKTK